MSATASDVLRRAVNDEPFLARFRADPAEALEEYDLEDEEEEALLSGDEGRIREVVGDVKADVIVIVISRGGGDGD